jgi:hypothetical protein
MLADDEASRAAVIEAWREQLHGGPGDLCLFALSGHGSWEPVSEDRALDEPDGRYETLVCHDSRTGDVPDLADVEIRALVDDAGRDGADVLLLVDACHSGGIAKDVDVAIRSAAPVDRPRREGFVTTDAAPASWAALLACEPLQLAAETRQPDGWRGAFTTALCDAARAMGPRVSRAELLAAAAEVVEARGLQQRPVVDGSSARLGEALLGGPARHVPGAVVAVARGRRVQLAGGAVHGLGAGDVVELDPLTGGGAGRAKVTAVGAGRAVARPLDGFAPADGAVFRARRTSSGGDALAVALRHVNEWHRLRGLTSERPPAVHVEIVGPAGTVRPADGDVVEVGDDAIELHVVSDAAAPVYAVLVDLDQALGASVAPLAGEWLAPGARARAFGGAVRLTPSVEGGQVHEWLTLIVSVETFDGRALELPPIADVLAEVVAAPKALVTLRPWGTVRLELVGGDRG